MTSRVGIFKGEQLGTRFGEQEDERECLPDTEGIPLRVYTGDGGSTEAGLMGGGGHTRCATLLCTRAKCGEHRQKAYNLPVFVSNNL